MSESEVIPALQTKVGVKQTEPLALLWIEVSEFPGSPIVVNRVVTSGMERMAAQESSDGKDQTSAHTECGDGLASKLRTRGAKTAGRKRQWRNYELVGPNTY